MKKSKLFAIILCLASLTSVFSIGGSAINVAYDDTYCIHDAISYAYKWGSSYGNTSVYERVSDERGGDCTNFVSQCLIAGNMKPDSNWNGNREYCKNICIQDGSLNHGYTNAYNTFTNVVNLFNYLTRKGYRYEECNANKGNPSIYALVGDIIQIYESPEGYHHSVLCVGHSSNGEILYSAHNNESSNMYAEKLSTLSCVKSSGAKIRVIHMSNTCGLKEVTHSFIGKKIAIKSVENAQYISSGTSTDTKDVNVSANRSSASTWEYFTVEDNIYGEVGFRANNGNYLATMIDISSTSSPIRAAYGQNYKEPQSYESFRIYESGGNYYIQSMANGRWVQVDKDNSDIVKAAGKSASTWERFQIEIITSNQTNNTGSRSGETEETYVTNRYCYISNYNKGTYTGSWKNGKPDGYGKLTYDTSDGYAYTLGDYKAIYYEGNFSNGSRYGTGTVVYEGGYKDVGTFYGSWSAGKVVFKGKRYLNNDKYEGYWPITITATSSTNANNSYGEWCSTKMKAETKTLSVIKAIDDNFSVTIPANFILHLYETNSASVSTYYIGKTNNAYNISCTQKCIMSDGSVRYCYKSKGEKFFYFEYVSGMKVSDSKLTGDTESTKINYTVSFDANGGTYESAKSMSTNTDGYIVIPFVTPYRDGYKFIGWSQDKNDSGITYKSGKKLYCSSDMTLYAIWERVFIYSPNEPTNTGSVRTVGGGLITGGSEIKPETNNTDDITKNSTSESLYSTELTPSINSYNQNQESLVSDTNNFSNDIPTYEPSSEIICSQETEITEEESPNKRTGLWGALLNLFYKIVSFFKNLLF